MSPGLERVLEEVPNHRRLLATRWQRLLGAACCVALAAFSTIAASKTGPRQPTTTVTRAGADDHPSGHARVGDRPVQIETHGLGFCARLESGRVACWGDNRHGQLGNGTMLPADGIVLVAGLDDAELLLCFEGATRVQAAILEF